MEELFARGAAETGDQRFGLFAAFRSHGRDFQDEIIVIVVAVVTEKGDPQGDAQLGGGQIDGHQRQPNRLLRRWSSTRTGRPGRRWRHRPCPCPPPPFADAAFRVCALPGGSCSVPAIGAVSGARWALVLSGPRPTGGPAERQPLPKRQTAPVGCGIPRRRRQRLFDLTANPR